MVRGDIVKIWKICRSLSCLTGAKPQVVCVSHRCSQTQHTKKNKKQTGWLALQRQGASSNICTWQPPVTKGNRGLASADGSSTTLPPSFPPPLQPLLLSASTSDGCIWHLHSFQHFRDRRFILPAALAGARPRPGFGPHDDPVAQPWNEAGLTKKEREGKKLW